MLTAEEKEDFDERVCIMMEGNKISFQKAQAMAYERMKEKIKKEKLL